MTDKLRAELAMDSSLEEGVAEGSLIVNKKSPATLEDELTSSISFRGAGTFRALDEGNGANGGPSGAQTKISFGGQFDAKLTPQDSAEKDTRITLSRSSLVDEELDGVFFENAPTETFAENEIIIDIKQANNFVYQVKSGTVRVEARDGDKHTVLATIGQGQTFGELSVSVEALQRPIAYVIAHTPKVEVRKLSKSALDTILKEEPRAAGTFYRVLGVRLAKALVGMNHRYLDLRVSVNDKVKKTNKDGAQQTGTKSALEDKVTLLNKFAITDLHGKFGIPPTEKILSVHAASCRLPEQHTSKPCYLIFTQSYLLVYCKIFGLEKTCVIGTLSSLKDGVDIQRTVNNNQLTFSGGDCAEEFPIRFSYSEQLQEFLTELDRRCLEKEHEQSNLPENTDGNQETSVEETATPIRSVLDEQNSNSQLRTFEGDLTEAEWGAILGGQPPIMYQDGSVVLEKGSENTYYWCIVQGRCSVQIEQELDDGTKERVHLYELLPGVTFGEISCLTGSTISTDVVAVGDVTLIGLDCNFLRFLFISQPELEAKFYRYVCSLLATRLHFSNKTYETLAKQFGSS